MMRNVTLDHTGGYDPSVTRRHTDTHPDCTDGFCLQMKGENDKCRFPLYFILSASNAILSGGYLLPHFISVSIDLGEFSSDAGGYHC